MKEVQQQHEEVRPIDRRPPDDLLSIAQSQYMEATALRHILKHLRSRRLMGPFKALTASAGVQLEHPLVTRLYDSIVSDGDWAEAERVLQLTADAGLFDAFAREAPAHAVWTRLCGPSADGDTPHQRGGHAMCIDEAAGRIYLYGGWDGERSLDDFWVYGIADGQWRVVPRKNEEEGEEEKAVWPGRRSCHKMALDAETGRIYLLGSLGVSDDALRDSGAAHMRDPTVVEPRALVQRADFYVYHTRGDDAGTWELLSANTEVARLCRVYLRAPLTDHILQASGGPPWIIDHQMVVDSAKGRLYVCGGRINDWSSETTKFSGLYSYDFATKAWSQLP